MFSREGPSHSARSGVSSILPKVVGSALLLTECSAIFHSNITDYDNKIWAAHADYENQNDLNLGNEVVLVIMAVFFLIVFAVYLHRSLCGGSKTIDGSNTVKTVKEENGVVCCFGVGLSIFMAFCLLFNFGSSENLEIYESIGALMIVVVVLSACLFGLYGWADLEKNNDRAEELRHAGSFWATIFSFIGFYLAGLGLYGLVNDNQTTDVADADKDRLIHHLYEDYVEEGYDSKEAQQMAEDSWYN